MRVTGGPTRPDTVVEYTDWNRVDAFGRALCADLAVAAGRAGERAPVDTPASEVRVRA
jgi:hypothetical protein